MNVLAVVVVVLSSPVTGFLPAVEDLKYSLLAARVEFSIMLRVSTRVNRAVSMCKISLLVLVFISSGRGDSEMMSHINETTLKAFGCVASEVTGIKTLEAKYYGVETDLTPALDQLATNLASLSHSGKVQYKHSKVTCRGISYCIAAVNRGSTANIPSDPADQLCGYFLQMYLIKHGESEMFFHYFSPTTVTELNKRLVLYPGGE